MNTTATRIAIDPALMNDIRSGQKQITIRKGFRDNYQQGPAIFYNSHFEDDEQPVIIDDVMFTQLRFVSHEEAVADGFTDVFALLDGLREFYPGITPYDEVTIVYFHVDIDDET